MKLIYLFFLFFLIFSCKSPDNGLFHFDPRSLVVHAIALSDIADDITYIPLDNSFPIGMFYNNIIFTNHSIYTSTKENGILAFDREGMFVKKIGSFGRGPGEYVYCYAIDVDENKETIYNKDSKTIKVYSKNGDFLRSFSLQEFGGVIDSFKMFDSKLFIFYKLQWEGAKYECLVLDTLGNVIKKKVRSIPEFKCEWGEPWLTYKFGNSMSYWNPFMDTVFSILPDLNNKASFIFSPGEHRMPRAKIYTFENYDKYFHPKRLFETSRFLVIIYSYKKSAIVLIDKHGNKSILTWLKGDPSGDGLNLTGGINNDIDGGMQLLPRGYFEENSQEYLFGIVFPLQIKILVSSIEFKNFKVKYPEKKKAFEKLANSLKETDNPVLMLVRLKSRQRYFCSMLPAPCLFSQNNSLFLN